MRDLGDYLARVQSDRNGPRLGAMLLLTFGFLLVMTLALNHGDWFLVFALVVMYLCVCPGMWADAIRRRRRYPYP